MRKSTAAALLGAIVIGAGAWTLWRPEVALSQNQKSTVASMAATGSDASCAGMMEHMMGAMMGGMHGMGNMGTMNGGETANTAMSGQMTASPTAGIPMAMPIIAMSMPNMVGMTTMTTPSSPSMETERRLTEIANMIDLLTQRIERLAPRLNPK